MDLIEYFVSRHWLIPHSETSYYVATWEVGEIYYLHIWEANKCKILPQPKRVLSFGDNADRFKWVVNFLKKEGVLGL